MDFLENSVRAVGSRGSVEVITGSMFSGKTEELIRRLRRAQFAGLKVEIFEPSLDKRYSENRIVSHEDKSIISTPVDSPSAILLLAGNVDVVAEYVTRIHAICLRCGHLAHYSFRKSDDEQVVLLGEKDLYEPLCRHCYNDALNKQ
jgi:thymidine kinase